MRVGSDRSPDFKAGIGEDEPQGQIPRFPRSKQWLCRCSVVISAAAAVPSSPQFFLLCLHHLPSLFVWFFSAKEKGRERREAAHGFRSTFLVLRAFLKREGRCCLFVTDGNPALDAAGFLQRVHWVMHKRKSKLPNAASSDLYTARWRPLARNCCKKIHAKRLGSRRGAGRRREGRTTDLPPCLTLPSLPFFHRRNSRRILATRRICGLHSGRIWRARAESLTVPGGERFSRGGDIYPLVESCFYTHRTRV